MAWWQKGSGIRIMPCLSLICVFFPSSTTHAFIPSDPALVEILGIFHWQEVCAAWVGQGVESKSTKLVKYIPKASGRSSSPEGMRAELTQLCSNLQCSVTSYGWWLNPGWLPWHLEPSLWVCPETCQPWQSQAAQCQPLAHSLSSSSVQHLCVFALLFQITQQKGNCGLLPSFAIWSG